MKIEVKTTRNNKDSFVFIIKSQNLLKGFDSIKVKKSKI